MLMKTYTTTNQSFRISVICNFIGHKYQIKRKITDHFSEYQCKCCGKQMTEDTRGRLIRLTPELIEINNTLRMIFQKRKLHYQNSSF
jgi:transposase-like protein